MAGSLEGKGEDWEEQGGSDEVMSNFCFLRNLHQDVGSLWGVRGSVARPIPVSV